MGRAGSEYLVFARLSLDRILGVLVLAALTVPTRHVEALVTDTAATPVLAVIAIIDARRDHRHPALQPTPPVPGRP